MSLSAAPVGYVYYFRSFGDWTVICGRDDSTRRDNCTLSAPPPEMHGAESQIEIGEGSAAAVAVTVRVRNTLMPDAPFFLRVDAKPPHQTTPNRFGEGGWSGKEAEDIIDELKTGQRVVVRWFAGPPPSPRDEFLSLNGFSEALADLGGKIGKGPLSNAAPAPSAPAAAAPAPSAPAAAAAGAAASTAQAEQEPAPRQQAVPQQPTPQAEPAAPAAAGSASPEEGKGVEIGDAAHIGRAQLAANVVNREPVDQVESPIKVTGSSGHDELYFFTEILDMAGKTVTHRWEFGGNVVATVPFKIGSARWRTYSRKSLSADSTGPWTVTASAPDGTVLARAKFIAE